MAGEIGRELGIPVEEYPANWDKWGPKAGPIRNSEMLEKGKPDMIWAFHDYLDTSKGTKDMVKKAATAGVSVLFFKHNEPPHLAQLRIYEELLKTKLE